MKKVIQDELKKIEEAKDVKIIMAIESGGRAWGFASPDSDYDVRFIYVRNTADYLRLDSIRDVIEWRLDDVLDISGRLGYTEGTAITVQVKSCTF